MTIEHAKANAGLWEFSYQEMSRQDPKIPGQGAVR